MAAVYAGTHRNGKHGAIKILHLELSLDAEARSRFLQEGYAANRVGHPGAVSVLDDDVAEDGAVFLVMELLDGRTVDSIANERPGKRLEPAEALSALDQLLDVLAAAHDKGIVHRDLKPENLFLTRQGALKVLDFGLARVRELRPNGHMTRMGDPMGTPAFMPPEQALGNWSQVDARSDLWAVGATFFALLTGRLVHQAATLKEFMLAAMTMPAAPIRSVLPSVPKQVAAILDKALAFDPKDRWQDARTMQRAVREARCAMGAPVPGPRGSRPESEMPSHPDAFAASVALQPPPEGAPRRTPRGLLPVVFGVAGAAALAVLLGIVATRSPSNVVVDHPSSAAQAAPSAPAPLAAEVAKPAPMEASGAAAPTQPSEIPSAQPAPPVAPTAPAAPSAVSAAPQRAGTPGSEGSRKSAPRSAQTSTLFDKWN